MNNGNQRQKLWKRILDRYQFRRSLLRARIPLVFFRPWLAQDFRQAAIPSHPARYEFNLHFELSWPQWLVNTYVSRTPLDKLTFYSSVMTKFQLLLKDRKDIDISAPEKAMVHPTLQATSSVERITTSQRGDVSHSVSSVIYPSRSESTLVRTEITQSRAEGSEPSTNVSTAPFTLQPYNKLFLNRLHSHFSERAVFTPVVFRNFKLPQRVSRSAAEGNSKLGAGVTAARESGTDGVARTVATSGVTPYMRAFQLPVVYRAPHVDQSKQSHSERSRLYAQSPSLDFVKPTSSRSTERVLPQEQSPSRHSATGIRQSQPQIDVSRLSEEVYRHIQRKIRIERERRGL